MYLKEDISGPECSMNNDFPKTTCEAYNLYVFYAENVVSKKQYWYIM
jgi:hypothetical protein